MLWTRDSSIPSRMLMCFKNQNLDFDCTLLPFVCYLMILPKTDIPDHFASYERSSEKTNRRSRLSDRSSSLRPGRAPWFTNRGFSPEGSRLCKNLYLSLRATEGSVAIPLSLEKKEIASSRRLGATPRKDTFYTVPCAKDPVDWTCADSPAILNTISI